MRENKKKESIFEKRWFFVALVVVVAAILITLTMNLILPESEKSNFDEDAWNDAVLQSSREDVRSVSSAATPVEAKDDEPETETTANEEVAPGPVDDGYMKMEKPVEGEINKDFSADELIYSETMQDWRVHEGIDFAVAEGADVRAAADGKVEEVITDGMLGAGVILVHDGGVKTFYGNLQEDSCPPKGTFLKTGEVVGKAGRTAAMEINDAPHIHFEVIKDNKNINPHLYLKDK